VHIVLRKRNLDVRCAEGPVEREAQIAGYRNRFLYVFEYTAEFESSCEALSAGAAEARKTIRDVIR